MILHVTGAVTPKDHSILWSSLIISIIIQETDPWNVTYTILPCIWAAFLAVVLRLCFRRSTKVIYNRNRMTIGVICLVVGLAFFWIGLDDSNDYLRIGHGLWHVFASLFGYYCIDGIQVV